MPISRQVLIAAPAFVLALVATPAHARPVPAPPSHPVVVLAEAERLAEAGQLKAARKIYKAAATDAIASGDYPAAALRGLANMAYFLGDNAAAAVALDDLASYAAEFGDPATQITALVDAAFLHQAMGNRAEVAEHQVRIKRLLKSPALSDETRAFVESRTTK